MTVRQILSLLCLAALVVLGTASHVLELPFIDRGPSQRAMARYSDFRWPDYPLFLEGVREHTKPGDSIAVIVPSLQWDNGYSYAYYRATYFLTGRTVLPLVTPKDGRLMQNFRDAKYIAVFGVSLRRPADVVWRNGRGTLLRLR